MCHHNFDKGSEQLDYFTIPVLCCESHPCHLSLYKAMLSSDGELLVEQALAPNIARRQLDATYVRAVHGTLGHGNRVVVPSCIRDFIRGLFPDPCNTCMGHKDSHIE